MTAWRLNVYRRWNLLYHRKVSLHLFVPSGVRKCTCPHHLRHTTTNVAPREADLLISIFVLTSALAASFVATEIDAGQVVLQCCRAVLGASLPSDPIVHESPNIFVASVWVVNLLVVPK